MRRSRRAGLSEVSDFNLVCLVLDGSDDAAEELLNRGIVPASLASHALAPGAGGDGAEAAFHVLASCVEDDARGLRSMPDGAELRDWLRLWTYYQRRGAQGPSGLRTPCATPGTILRFARGRIARRARGDVAEHLGGCKACDAALRFERSPRGTAVPVRLGIDGLREGRKRVRALLSERAPIVGFGLNDEIARVLYTSGDRGIDVFASEDRVMFCEGARIRLGELTVQVKCLLEQPEDAERYSLGAVFSATGERLPVFLDLEQEGQKQVTLRDGAAEFRYIRGGTHVLRFGRFKGQSILLDIKPYASQLGDLLLIADGLTRKAEEASGAPLEIALFYRLCDVTLRAWAAHRADPRPLLRVLRTYFGRPIAAIDPAALAAGRAPARDRDAFVRLHRAGPLRAVAFAASQIPELERALRPLAVVFLAREARDDGRLFESLTALRAHALPEDIETDRYVRSLCEWLGSKGRDTTIREDLMAKLAAKYVAGLIARFDASAERPHRLDLAGG
ncbi:MAG: hypothetical protein U0166_14135 [Acidobacteriota bacterium]